MRKSDDAPGRTDSELGFLSGSRPSRDDRNTGVGGDCEMSSLVRSPIRTVFDSDIMRAVYAFFGYCSEEPERGAKVREWCTAQAGTGQMCAKAHAYRTSGLYCTAAGVAQRRRR